MKAKVVVLSLAVTLFVVSSVNAQWRIGGTAGATYNHYSIDTRYMSGINYANAWGNPPKSKFPIGTFGIMAQYDILNWLGIRTDLNYSFKNHKMSITQNLTNYEAINGYIQLPVMASFNIDYKKISAFCNLGIYGAYWFCNHKSGTQDVVTYTTTDIIKNDLINKRDQRFEYGLVGGIGVEWYFYLLKQNWACQIEARVYYSTQSTQKHYMRINDPRYNTTLALQSGLCYFF